MQRSLRHALLLSLLTLGACSPPPPEPTVAEADPLAEVERMYTERRFDELAEALLEAQKTQPLGPEATLRLAQAQAALGEVPKAVLTARKGVEAHPQYYPLALILAEVYSALNQHALAADALRTARANGCPDADVALFLGVCLGRMVDLEGARAEFDRARAAGVPQSEIDYNLAVLLHQQRQDVEAEERLRRVMETTPEHPLAQRELARVLLAGATADDPRLEEAEQHINASLDRDPEDWRAYELMGDASMLREDFEASVAYYTEALRYGHNPEHVEHKYRAAASAQRAWLIEQGVLAPPEASKGEGLPDKVKESLELLKHQGARGTSQPADGGH